MSRDCCVALPRGAKGLSAVCDRGISVSYPLTISEYMNVKNIRSFWFIHLKTINYLGIQIQISHLTFF